MTARAMNEVMDKVSTALTNAGVSPQEYHIKPVTLSEPRDHEPARFGFYIAQVNPNPDTALDPLPRRIKTALAPLNGRLENYIPQVAPSAVSNNSEQIIAGFSAPTLEGLQGAASRLVPSPSLVETLKPTRISDIVPGLALS